MVAAKRLVFIDSGLLIAASRGIEAISSRALSVLGDPTLRFASSELVRIEVLPKAIYYKRVDEAEFYRTYFAAVSIWAPFTDALLHAAYAEAIRTGISAIDVLHAAAAVAVQAEEFITVEGILKPIHRTTLIQVRTIAA